MLKAKAKELIEQDKKKEAKKILEEATRLKKQMEVIYFLFRLLRQEKG